MVKSFGIVAGAAAVGFPVSTFFQAQPNGKDALGNRTLGNSVNALLIGAGSRGLRFAGFAEKHPGQLRIAGLAEPMKDRRQKFSNAFGIEAQHCLNNWQEVFQKKPIADVVIITASGNYTDACATALRAGYHVLVDRPASLDLDEVIAINKIACESNRQLRFCYIHDGALNFMEHTQFETNPARV